MCIGIDFIIHLQHCNNYIYKYYKINNITTLVTTMGWYDFKINYIIFFVESIRILGAENTKHIESIIFYSINYDNHYKI